MELTLSTISDYYPLNYDITEKKGTTLSNPSNANHSAEELVAWSLENNMTEMQTLTLLVKNAFEGHLCHLNGISIERLVKYGTFQIDLDSDIYYRELACEFLRNLNSYQKGIELAWKKVVVEHARSGEIDFQSMLLFIITNQLFRLPVSYLKSYDSRKFCALSGLQRNQFRLQFMLHISMLNHVAHRSFIEMVNEKYLEKFKNILLRLQSKENVLMQLNTKLDYANDPSIETEEDLEKKYFDFLIATNISKSEKRKLKLMPEMIELPEDRNFQQLLKSQIKKLYKVISKNCSEVHTQIEGQERYHLLSQYFMAATSIYNDFATDFSSLMLQHTRLILLFIKVINYRKINDLPVMFTDFTGLTEKQSFEIKEEDVLVCQHSLQKILEMELIIHFIDFKIKYVKDEEMANIHKDYLNRQLKFLEQRIIDIMKEIKQVMQNKLKVTGSF